MGAGMKLYSVAITAEERDEQGWKRVIDAAMSGVRHACENACATRSLATIKIAVTAEEPEREDT